MGALAQAQPVLDEDRREEIGDRPQDDEQCSGAADIGRLEEVQIGFDLEHLQRVARPPLRHRIDDVELLDRVEQPEQRRGQALSLAEALAYVQTLPLHADPALADQPVLANQAALNDLTQREREVVALIGQGKSNSAIAEQLVLSKRTVEKHIANILAKLAMTNRAQLVRWAVEHDLT